MSVDAEKTADAGQAAAQAAHELIGVLIDGNSALNEKEKIVAGISAICGLYEGLVNGAVEWDDANDDRFILEIFTRRIGPMLAKIGKRLKDRQG